MTIVIVGAGKTGFQISKMLAEAGHNVVVIDSREETLTELSENLDVMTVHGNGASGKVLKDAGLVNSDLFIAVTDSDEVNMVACMTAKHLSAKKTVARIRNPEYHGLSENGLSLTQLGIDVIISPEEAVAYEAFKFLRTPAATEVRYFADGKVQMLGFKVQENSPIAGMTVKDANITSCTIGAILRSGEVLVPHGGTHILAGDNIFIIGKTGAPTEIGWLVGTKDHTVRSVAILGGGRTGLLLAHYLEQNRRHIPIVKVIEHDEDTCHYLARELHHALVIRGDGAKPDIFHDNTIQSVDAFVALTGEDQTNLLAGYMAKHAGVKSVVVKLKREDYMPIASQMGIDATVIPRMIFSGTILRLIHNVNVVSLTLLGKGDLEVMEISLPHTAKICNKPLQNLGFPKGAIVGSVIRGDTIIIPRGNTVLLPGDRIVVFAMPSVVPHLEDCIK
ncbi:MAG: Trk system potassium transporter TrkA [Firmicutes bacterium]|nr:Trk system potassium transporter TrkA [Bacillota bacterium]